MVGKSKTQGSTVQTKPLGVAAPRGFIFVSHGGLHFISFRDNYTTYIYFFQAIKNYSAGKANKKPFQLLSKRLLVAEAGFEPTTFGV